MEYPLHYVMILVALPAFGLVAGIRYLVGWLRRK